MVLEYAHHGDLLDYVESNHKFNDLEASKIMRQVLCGLRDAHSQGIAHRDIKLANILLDQDYNVKITDFGLSKQYEMGEKLKTCCGSPCFAAPELIAQLPYDPEKSDIWSASVVLYAMLCQTLPFYH